MEDSPTRRSSVLWNVVSFKENGISHLSNKDPNKRIQERTIMLKILNTLDCMFGIEIARLFIIIDCTTFLACKHCIDNTLS